MKKQYRDKENEKEAEGRCVAYVCDDITKVRCASCLSHVCALHGNHCMICTTLAAEEVDARFCADCMGSDFEYCDNCQSSSEESDDEKSDDESNSDKYVVMKKKKDEDENKEKHCESTIECDKCDCIHAPITCEPIHKHPAPLY